MRGSKYLQSDTAAVFGEVKQLLDAGREVLFSGTPCQVAALYSFLGGRPEKLTTVDFICHGVPSPLAFEGFLRHLEVRYGSAATGVRFRDQSRGCVPMRIGVDFADGRSYLGECGEDPFFKVFLSGISNRPSCNECPFARLPRGSDLTIADNWRFAAFAPEWNDNTGVSTLIVNTPRGAEIVREAEASMELKPCTLEQIDQRYLHCPGGEHPDRGLFFKALRRRGFARAAADLTGPRPLLRRLRSRMSKLLRILCGKKCRGCGI
jgi:coenzyme F420-reducing hydrogenase beta subunit